MAPTFDWQRHERLGNRPTRRADLAALRALRRQSHRSFRVASSIDADRWDLGSSDTDLRRTLLCDGVVVGAVSGTTGRLGSLSSPRDLSSTLPRLETDSAASGTLLVEDLLFSPPRSLAPDPGRLVAAIGIARTAQIVGLERAVVPVVSSRDDDSPYSPAGYLEQCRAGAVSDPAIAPFLRAGFRLRSGVAPTDDPPRRLVALLEWESPQ